MNNATMTSETSQASEQSTGTVVSVAGEASLICVLENLDLERTTLRTGDQVYPQQVVETARGSELTIRWDNGEIWTLGGDQHAELSTDMHGKGWQLVESGYDTDEIDALLESLEPTAAGPTTGALNNDDGTRILIIDRGNESDPYQAFDTPGVDTDGVTPYQPPGLVSEDIPLQPVASEPLPTISASFYGNYLPEIETEFEFVPVKYALVAVDVSYYSLVPSDYVFEANLDKAWDEPVSVDYVINAYSIDWDMDISRENYDELYDLVYKDLFDDGVLNDFSEFSGIDTNELVDTFALVDDGKLTYEAGETTQLALGSTGGELTPEFVTIQFSDPQNALLGNDFVTVDPWNLI